MKRPENLLFHSRIEICRILQVLAQEHCPVFADIKNGHSFSSHMLAVDPDADRFSIAYCGHKPVNTILLNSPSVEFTASNHPDLYFSFEATAPEETRINGEPAIQFALPKTVLMHNRREHSRTPIPADLSLRCIADAASVMPFESHIADISHDGFGCLIYDPDIKLKAGAILKNCRIIMPGGDAVVADLELRHITSITLADGSLNRRAGFRFIQKPEQITRLVGLFIEDMDKK